MEVYEASQAILERKDRVGVAPLRVLIGTDKRILQKGKTR